MKIQSLIIALAFALFLNPLTALAAWSSGGGHLFTDEQNPWFIENTPTVRYCVQIDEKNFGVEKDVALAALSKGLHFWKTQIRKIKYEEPSFKARVGTQQFREVDCGLEDITFKFGVLSPEEEKRLKSTDDFDSVIGIAIRTSYDRANLKAKGFVYISPQTGPLAPTGEIDRKRWEYNEGANLEIALIHELGHVFGMPHTRPNTYMAENYLSRAFRPNHASWTADQSRSESNEMFSPPTESVVLESCNVNPETATLIFGLKKTDTVQCVRVELDDRSNAKILHADSKDDAYELIGTITSPITLSTQPEFVVTLVVPSEQKVFWFPEHMEKLRLFYSSANTLLGLFEPSNPNVGSSPIQLAMAFGEGKLKLRRADRHTNTMMHEEVIFHRWSRAR